VVEGLERHRRAAAGGVVRGDQVRWAGGSEESFQIGSVTKVFTSLLLATYVVDGSLRLDHRVGQLVPELSETEVGATTLEQLATHTSGLPRVPRELWRRALTRHPDPYADLDHDRLVASLVGSRLRPKSRPAYSNLGAGLLGHAIATWAGGDFNALVQERICRPLGLTAPTVRPTAEPPGDHHRGTTYSGTWHFDALAGAGALWSTLADQLRFLSAQLEPPAGELGAAVRLTHAVRVPGKRLDQCLGWLQLRGRDGTLLWHNGVTAGYRSFIGVQDGSAVAVLTACDRSVDAVGIGLLKGLLGD